MRCYYEVLGVGVSADGAAIKKAYRVEALKWHPDKNQHRLEEADERFKEVQNAYEVLSDKHERTWYDNHKEEILKADSHQAGGGGWFGGGSKRPADEEDLFSYFSARCYSGYGDDKKGFHAVYGAVFERVVLQEVAAAERQGRDPARQAAQDLPRFGTSEAPWARVAAFYDAFLTFATCKEFAWADEHNPASAPNRKVRRLMEDDNAKRRKALRRHYNETVRELATFVRKRDKRVLLHMREEADRRVAREAEVAATRAADKAARAAAAAEYQEPDWVQASEPQISSEEEDDEGDLKDWHCVVCNKTFRSEAAMANHERSRKHVDKLAEMREELEAEGHLVADADSSGEAPAAEQAAAGGDGAASDSAGGGSEHEDQRRGRAGGAGSDTDSDPNAAAMMGRSRKQQAKKLRKQQAKRAALSTIRQSAQEAGAAGPAPAAGGRAESPPATHPSAHDSAPNSSGEEASDSAQSAPTPAPPARSHMQRQKKQRKQRTKQAAAAAAAGSASDDGAGGDEDDVLAAMMRNHMVRQQETGGEQPASTASRSATSSEGGRPAAATAATPPPAAWEACAAPEAADSSDDERGGPAADDASVKKPRRRKGKKVRGNGAVAAPIDAPVPANTLECGVCHDLFTSRTALFRHLKEAGHAVVKR